MKENLRLTKSKLTLEKNILRIWSISKINNFLIQRNNILIMLQMLLKSQVHMMRVFKSFTPKLTLCKKITQKIIIKYYIYIFIIVNYLNLILVKSSTFKLGSNSEIYFL